VTTKLFNNQPVEVLRVRGAWTNVRPRSGDEKSVRNGQLSDPPKPESKPEPQRKSKPSNESNGKVALRPDRSRYTVGAAETATGRKTIDIGDATAELLRGKALYEIYRLAAAKLDEGEDGLRARYQHLNLGMQRMNLGNRLRHRAE
jgi:hypothetical protein